MDILTLIWSFRTTLVNVSEGVGWGGGLFLIILKGSLDLDGDLFRRRD